MKALVFTAESDYLIREVDVPTPSASEILLRVDCCGICGTDLHAPEWVEVMSPPVILGHEFAGIVQAVGDGVTKVAAGDRVVVNPLAFTCARRGDGHVCRNCRAGFSNQCERAVGELVGFQQDGGMAEYVALDQAYAVPVPAHLPLAVAAWSEPLAVVVRGVGHEPIPGAARVAVLGAGPIGQLALQVAIARGADAVVVVDPSEFRRGVAERCGAHEVLEPGQLADREDSFDLILDCTGVPAGFESAMRLARHGARIAMIGAPTLPLTIADPTAALLKELSIAFTVAYDAEADFLAAVELLADGTVDAGPLTTGILPLDQHAEAFSLMRRSEAAVKFMLSVDAAA